MQVQTNNTHTSPNTMDSTRSAAQQTLDREHLNIMNWRSRIKLEFLLVLYDLSQLLNTQLDREQLATCVAMIENGVNPEALAVCGVRCKSDDCLLKSRFIGSDQGLATKLECSDSRCRQCRHSARVMIQREVERIEYDV